MLLCQAQLIILYFVENLMIMCVLEEINDL